MLVSLDIGTSKVAVVVAEDDSETGQLRIAGMSSQQSHGLKRSMVADIEATVLSIRRAVEEASLMADCEIIGVVAGVGGHHIQCITSSGVVGIEGGEVSELDVERVIDAAKAVVIPADRKILHVLPIEYVIDGQDGVIDPVGMAGVRLEVEVHIITCSRNVSQNIEKCIERCGLTLERLVANQIAAGEAVLSQDEKELGACVIDMGGGTLDMAVYMANSISHTAVIPLGGDQVTNDVAMAFSTPVYQAEDLKVRYASALSQRVDHNDLVKVPSVGGRAPRDLSRQQLASIVQPRYVELFNFARDELIKVGAYEKLAAGIVLTGGAATIEGAVELAEGVFKLPVRIAKPRKVFSNMGLVDDPIFSTAVGLMVDAQHNGIAPSTNKPATMKSSSSVGGAFRKIVHWWKTQF